jgi:hypothetical protein
VCIGDTLREERVERDLVLCEPLNMDVGFFVNSNLEIKSCVSHVFLRLLVLFLLFTFLLSISCIRSSLLGISLSSVDLAYTCFSCSLVGRLLIPLFIILPWNRPYCKPCFVNKIIVWRFCCPKPPTGQSPD